ncbi:hypothetical protein, partial [Nocardia abscessus]|uniref:hypothetical protein n=1 Tax=Nocardia abscessus TaxID=120957 RepID=UPI0024561472
MINPPAAHRCRELAHERARLTETPGFERSETEHAPCGGPGGGGGGGGGGGAGGGGGGGGGG